MTQLALGSGSTAAKFKKTPQMYDSNTKEASQKMIRLLVPNCDNSVVVG